MMRPLVIAIFRGYSDVQLLANIIIIDEKLTGALDICIVIEYQYFINSCGKTAIFY